MDIGDRLRSLREAKNISQGTIEERTGLLRCYISRVENGHTVPAVKTLAKFARALDVNLYELLYDGDAPPKVPALNGRNGDRKEWGMFGKDSRYLNKLRRFLARMSEEDRETLALVAQRVTQRKKSRVKARGKG
jgi:transcriptional regulator with XRE-family HTH domain